jgi:hypothetical protein
MNREMYSQLSRVHGFNSKNGNTFSGYLEKWRDEHPDCPDPRITSTEMDEITQKINIASEINEEARILDGLVKNTDMKRDPGGAGTKWTSSTTGEVVEVSEDVIDLNWWKIVTFSGVMLHEERDCALECVESVSSRAGARGVE